MMRALHLLILSLAAVGPGRTGADSARVATLLAALAHTDPVICDLIGDQLGNFWMGGEPGRLGRFDDAPNVQGAKDSLAGTITDPRAVSLLVATLGTENPCVRRVAAKLLGRSVVTAAVLRGGGWPTWTSGPRWRGSRGYSGTIPIGRCSGNAPAPWASCTRRVRSMRWPGRSRTRTS